MLTVPASQYGAAFDAALEAADQRGYGAQLRDRRAGIIETDPAISPSLIEPWEYDGFSAGQVVENTIAMQRRRVRFEFMPAGFAPSPLTAEPPFTGPAVIVQPRPSESGQPVDLTQTDHPLELRIWAFIERSHTIGQRRSTWTRLKTTQSTIPGVEQRFWVPVARDKRLERRLLAAVQDAMPDRSTHHPKEGEGEGEGGGE